MPSLYKWTDSFANLAAEDFGHDSDSLPLGAPVGTLWNYTTWFLLPSEGEQMRPVNGFFLYRLGTLCQLFSVQAQGFKVSTYDAILNGSSILLRDHVVREENKRYLPKSTEQAVILKQIIDELRKMPDWVFPTNVAAALHHHVNKFQSLPENDLQALKVYQLEKKRTHMPAMLDGHAEDVLSLANREALTEFAVENIREAGRCLVFDRFTGCGFHAMRAVEDIARRYFVIVTNRVPTVRKKSGEEAPMTLGQIAGELLDKWNIRKGKRESIGQLGIIAPLLDQLTQIYRNRFTHPEIIALEEDRAVDVFNQATNVIGAMLDDVRVGGEHLEWKPF